MSARTAGVAILFVILSLGLAARAYRQGEVVYRTGSDFSSFWLGGMWVRERPEGVALYYPNLSDGRPNERIWTTAIAVPGETYEPWYAWGRRQGFTHPKFYLYPPIFALAFVPLTGLSLKAAVITWQLANTACFIGAVAVLGALTRPRQVSSVLWASAILAFSLPFYPVTWSQELGQNSLLLFLPWVLLLWSLVRGREYVGGVMLAVLGFVKLNPVLLIPWLAWRRFHSTLLAAGFASVVLMALSVMATGWDEVRTYFIQVVPALSAGTAFHENQSVLGLLLRSRVDENPGQPFSGAESPRAIAQHTLIALLVIGLQALVVLRARAGPRRSVPEEFCGWMLVVLIVSPVSWSHHLVVVIIALACLAARLIDAGGRRSLIPALVLGAVYLLVGLPQLSSKAWLRIWEGHRLLMSARLFGVALLWGCLQWVALRVPAAEARVWTADADRF